MVCALCLSACLSVCPQLNLKFEIEVLCKNLGLELAVSALCTPVTPPTCLLPACQPRPFALQDIKPSQLLGVAEAVRRSQLYSPPPGQPAEEFRSPNMHPSHAVPRPLFHYEDINIASLAGLAQHIEINPQVREGRGGEWKGEGEGRGREGRNGEGKRRRGG